MFEAGSGIRIIGHRGAAGIAPENTVVSIQRGVAGGAQAIEIDLRLSADGTLVVIHDATVDRTTDGTGPVEDRTLEEIRRLDAGYRLSLDRGRTFPFRDEGHGIPTLDEAVEAASGLPMVLEVKSLAAGEALADWLRARPDAGERFIVGGYEHEFTLPVAETGVRRCATRADLLPFVALGKLGIRGGLPGEVGAVMVPVRKGVLRLATRRLVRHAHANGVGVFVWTVNRPSAMRELFDLGVDGLISDVPARVRRIVDERVAGGGSFG